MGSNRRYPGHDLDRAINEVTIRPSPITLTDQELDLEHQRVVTPAAPIPVHAWVRFHEGTIRPDAEAIAWTDRAVKVRWVSSGRTYSTWVWASAVDKRG